MDHAVESVGVEPEGLAATSILGMVIAIMVLLAVIVVVGVELALHEIDNAETAAIETTGYPLLRETQSAAQALLTASGASATEEGVYQIPIEQAMRLVIAESGAGSTAEITVTR